MKDFLTLNKNMLGATISGSRFNSSRRGSSSSGSSGSSNSSTSSGSSSSSTSSSSTKIDKTTTPPGAVGFHSSSGESWTVYYDSKGNKYNSIEEYQAEMKRQEEERKRQANNNTSHSSGGHDGHVNSEDIRYQIQAAHIKAEKERAEQAATGGNYGFNLDDYNVRNLINNSDDSEDDNTLLYAILAGIGIVGVAFLAKKNKNKKKKKRK